MMISKQTQIVILLVSLYFCSVYLFTRGFLLKRSVIERTSRCEDFTGEQIHEGAPACHLPRYFKRAVVLVIDALRYDFAKYDPNIDPIHAKNYQNKLPVFHELISSNLGNAMLMQFVADPPTTTMQRLKALTTGSLPTFIDVGDNFAGTEIAEDNIIQQLINFNNSITFMGDDTWESLYSGKFQRAFYYPSFNVKDLHTVDNSIMLHLLPEMREAGWNLLIAHFLGVDHCGHRYGPMHAEMAKKLLQMDATIRNVVEGMDNETILFVMGDHGMTITGDHGGDSDNELNAALFVYAKGENRFNIEPGTAMSKKIAQIDFVPTFSLLLGVPIPFSNLGAVTPELFHGGNNNFPPDRMDVIQLLYLNAKQTISFTFQVHGYLDAYTEISSDFPHEQLSLLAAQYNQIYHRMRSYKNGIISDNEMFELQALLETYLADCRKMCQEVWANFNLITIASGLILASLTIILNVCVIADPQTFTTKFSWTWLLMALFAGAFCGMLIGISLPLGMFSKFNSTLFFMSVSVVLTCLAMMQVCGVRKPILKILEIGVATSITLPVCITIVNCLSMFSNSFVVWQDSVNASLLQAALWSTWFIFSSKTTPHEKEKFVKSRKFSMTRLLKGQRIMMFIMVLVCSVTVRLSTNFRKCREEQAPECEISDFLTPIANFASEDVLYRTSRFLLACASATLPILVLRFWLRHLGNLNGYTSSVLSAKYILPFASACIILHWAVQCLPTDKLESLSKWQLILFPQLAYAGILLSIIAVIWDPLCIYSPPQQQRTYQSNNVVPSIYKQLSSQRSQEPKDGPALIYGLATVFSSTNLIFCATTLLLAVLLHCDGLAASFFLMTTCAIVLTKLFSSYRALQTCNSDNLEKLINIQTIVFTTFSLLTERVFFASGHQPTFASIHWTSAFVGFIDDHSSNVVPAVLVLINTFAGQILVTCLLPLLLFWPLSNTCKLEERKTKKEDGSVFPKGEFTLCESADVFRHALMCLWCKWILFQALQTVAVMTSALLLRRHLMVWKIFAPRFLFQATGFIITCCTVISTNFLTLRSLACLNRWVGKLGKWK